ncbi:hypothetical protein PV729_26585 [Streptomyces europaeiscabiei]|uniref:Scaffolding protein n=1 Tax=Streptomyces europaeiscabiei TaxID=146819 RepID=A0ABU4NU00_9ACTN|nr:hypothetical protein [Streptomyces europaeiscabiei]MDX3555290.1 hypothetical protein [Streptomyces europaeiscabiei]MDX3705304.1 hypothetical protein [Streptomyces europaeiscabiei]
MSTPTPPPADPGGTPQAPPPAPEPPQQAAQPAETDWRAEAKKWEARAKENKGAADRLTQLEEANKTEAQKLADRAAKAEGERDGAKAEALRWRIAARNGISDEDAEIFLTGTTEEALSRQAERLVALRGGSQQAAAAVGPQGQRTPVEALRPGALPNPPEPTLADQIAAAEKAGEWGTAQRLKAQQLMQLANPNQ